MNTSPAHLTIVLLTVALVLLCGLIAGAAAGILTHIDGASRASAVLRGAVAFAGTTTLCLAVLTFMTTA